VARGRALILKSYRVLLVTLFTWGMIAVAGAAPPEVKSISNPDNAAPAKLADFRGLVGNWIGPHGAAGFSEAVGGQMVGHLLLLNDDKSPRVEELWIIRQDGEHVIVRQKHYSLDLKEREQKDQWTERAVVAIDRDDIYLNNLTWATSRNALQLLVNIPAANGAPPQHLFFSFTRAK
jgi:Domain of unknown function (DUF6265)